MTERPIIFSGPMVRAILEGRKTVTRRVLKPQPYIVGQEGGYIGIDSKGHHLPFAVGDLLWVRETWARACELDENDEPASEMMTYYRADGEPFTHWLDPVTDEWRDGIKWRPSIHMPRRASRITLRVTEVRVQRLREISEEDAWAEGCKKGDPDDVGGFFPAEEPQPKGGFVGWDCARDWYADLWDAINGEGSWEANPWVTAITFERVHGLTEDANG